jgi:hypothetical protein
MASLLVMVIPAASASVSSVDSTLDGVRGDVGDRSISFVGAFYDRPDLGALGLGKAGYWFPQFAAVGPVSGAPTGDNVRDELPGWIAAFNHTTGPADPGCTEPDALARGCTPTYYFRTFSQDGPARSAGGRPGWSRLRLPSGECGASGAIVDPHTYAQEQQFDDPTGVLSPPTGEPRPNSNNTVNRIQLDDGVPRSLFVSVVTDNTGREHDPDRLEIRGNVGLLDVPSEVADSQIEPTFVRPIDLTSNGVPDVYVFQIEKFTAGDYLKLRLRGSTSAASFAGLLFDERLDPALKGAGRARSCR